MIARGKPPSQRIAELQADNERLRSALNELRWRAATFLFVQTDENADALRKCLPAAYDIAYEQSAPICADHPHCPCGEAKMRKCNWKKQK